MKIKYMGKLDPETNPLPTNKLKEGAIRFNEPTDRKKQNIQTSIVTFIIICIMFVPEYLNVLFRNVDSMDLSNLFSYFILANILLVLSKLCQFYFYKEIYMFKIPRVGFAGVYTTEFTKKKYIAIIKIILLLETKQKKLNWLKEIYIINIKFYLMLKS